MVFFILIHVQGVIKFFNKYDRENGHFYYQSSIEKNEINSHLLRLLRCTQNTTNMVKARQPKAAK